MTVASAVDVLHAIPGRLRVRIARLRGDAALAASVIDELSGVAGVEQIEANPVTGSLLIVFDPRRFQTGESLASLWSVISRLFPDVDFTSLDLNAMSASLNGASHADSAQRNGDAAGLSGWANTWSNAEYGADGLRVLPWVLAALGMRDLLFGKTNSAPAWHDYFWFAFATYH